jgi:hypothetical protein
MLVRRRAVKVTAGIGLLLGAALMSEACRTATQVELVVTYDGACSDLREVAFIIGTDPTVAEGRIESNVFTTTTSHCEPGSPSRVGTLVVTPNDATGRASIIVLASFGGQHVTECKPEKGYFGCIIARRAFAFVDHTALMLDIPLETSCKNVPCDAESTCKKAACVTSNVSCTESGCNPPGAIADGGIEFTDAPTTSDAYVQAHDAQPPPVDGSPPPVDGSVDGPMPTDAPVDAPPEASGCNGSNQFVSCTKPGPQLAICSSAAPVCCYGSGSIALIQDATIGMGYDCRPADMCMPQAGNPNLNCRGAANCNPGSVCCFDNSGAGGTFCYVGSTCPMEGAMTSRVCGAGCECPAGKTCIGPRSVGSSPAQSVLICQ